MPRFGRPIGRLLGDGRRVYRLDALWRRARAWAEMNGKVHSYALVEGVAPL